jgi:shikimate kinase
VFSLDVPARLVLVTCTGAYDPATRSYRDNLVVYASPVP